MSLELIHLRKLLRLMYLTPNRQVAELRSDIRQDIARDAGTATGGGDFHGPFWSDARDHVFNRRDLHTSVQARIDSNPGRERLYPRLRDGFLLWWNERRRWTNEPFQPLQPPHGRFGIEGLGTVKVENILSVRDAAGEDHFIYPYFAEAPLLGEEGARLGLWLMREALPDYSMNDMRILDVMRGQPFSVDRHSLRGDEEQILRTRWGRLIDDWRNLREEYP